MHELINLVLAMLCQDATAYVLNKHKALFPYCEQGANRLVKLAKDNDMKLRKVGGFHGWTQHWWTIDDATGVIYDPTSGQFGRTNGVIAPGDAGYERYEEVPRDALCHISRGSSDDFSVYERWCDLKRWLPHGVERTIGHDREPELRTAKNGVQYWTFLQEAYLYMNKPVTTCVNIFLMRNSIVATSWYAKRIVTPQDKAIVKIENHRRISYKPSRSENHIFSFGKGGTHRIPLNCTWEFPFADFLPAQLKFIELCRERRPQPLPRTVDIIDFDEVPF